LPQLGKPMNVSNAKAKSLMGMNFIPVEVTLRESAEYLIKNGL
jgi:dihydroflavonol-4-reductase